MRRTWRIQGLSGFGGFNGLDRSGRFNDLSRFGGFDGFSGLGGFGRFVFQSAFKSPRLFLKRGLLLLLLLAAFNRELTVKMLLF